MKNRKTKKTVRANIVMNYDDMTVSIHRLRRNSVSTYGMSVQRLIRLTKLTDQCGAIRCCKEYGHFQWIVNVAGGT